MASQKGRGRGYDRVHQDATKETQDLAVYLRELMQRAGKKQRDLAGTPTGYGKSRIQEFLSGKAVPQLPFLEKFVAAVVPPRGQAVALARCRELWQKTQNPAPAPLAPAPVASVAPRSVPAPDEVTGAAEVVAAMASAPAQPPPSLASVAATAQKQAARAQEELTLARERNEQLSQERNQAQQWVLALGSLIANLQQQAASLKERQDKEAQAQLTQLTEQMETAAQELERARAGRNEAEQLAQRLRRRADELEEQIAELRQTTPAPAFTAEFGMPGLPEGLKEAFIRADFAKVLADAEDFLDQGQDMRDELVDEWGFTAPRRTPAQRIERWRTTSHVLGRSLGCLMTMSGALAHAAVTRAHAGGWTLPLDLMILFGLTLCADPWEPAQRMWPWVRAALRGDHLAGPLRVSAQGAALRAVRCAAAMLATLGAVLCLTAATDWSGWWLVPLLPATTAAAAYAVVGRDRHLSSVVQQTIGQLAAELETPRPHAPRTPGNKPALALADQDWLDARRKELGDALTDGWALAAGWVKAVAITIGTLLAIGVLGTLSTPLVHTVKGWSSSGLVSVVDHPVHRYLTTHTTGLPIPASTVHWIWVATGAAMLLLSWVYRSFSARITWTVWGAGTVVMVWSGTTGPARQVAAALTLIAWGIASIAALRGLGRRAPHNITADTSA